MTPAVWQFPSGKKSNLIVESVMSTTSSGESLPPLQEWLPLLQESLAKQGRFRWRLRGTSMAPTLSPGCEVEIVPPAHQISRGHLIVFIYRGTLIVHRLIHRRGDQLFAQGDGRWHPDPPLQWEQVLGQVVAAYQNGIRVWPTSLSPLNRWYWIGRAYGLWLLRRLYRWLQ
jgi:hypothetical protein